MTCEICGNPATVTVRDSIESDPKTDEHGVSWATYRPGEPHHYCNDHRRKPRTLDRNGIAKQV